VSRYSSTVSTSPGVFLFRLRREVRRGFLSAWVLEQLAEGPAYGYELLERIARSHGDAVKVGASTLYPTLSRLRAAGFVRCFHGTVSSGPLRKYYELTAEGRGALPAVRALWTEVAELQSHRTDRPAIGEATRA
jgi:PadR family transcriptional regulator, regulatory protein PadR